MRLAHVTDPHLDHLRPRPEVRTAFAEYLAEESDACVITGDISTYVEPDLLPHFARKYGKPIYFVLGNHDYWGGGFLSTKTQVMEMVSKNENLHWLSRSGPIDIAPGVQLCGVDGWYDAHYGSWRDSSMAMVDWSAIRDFYGKHLVDIVQHCRDRARTHAILASEHLELTTAPKVIFATHVPPYRESAMHEGVPSTMSALPWYTSKVMGDALSAWAVCNPERQLVTLCGHVHSPSEHHPEPNHVVYCGAAAYGSLSIAKVFEL